MATRAVEAEKIGESVRESIDDYRVSLHAAGKSTSTQAVYTLALGYLDDYLAAKGMPGNLGAIRREHIESWLAATRPAGRLPSRPPSNQSAAATRRARAVELGSRGDRRSGSR